MKMLLSKLLKRFQKFVGYLVETYVFHLLPRFDNKLRIMQKAPLKAYVVDNGFIAAKSFELTPNKGKQLENIVFIELMRRGYQTGLTLFYYRTKNDKEIDFVCRDAHKVTALIQVSYQMDNAKTLNRETSALNEASKELRCENRIILTYGDTYKTKDGIDVKSITEWLITIPLN